MVPYDVAYRSFRNHSDMRVIPFRRRLHGRTTVPTVYVGPTDYFIRNLKKFEDMFTLIHDMHMTRSNLMGVIVTGHFAVPANNNNQLTGNPLPHPVQLVPEDLANDNNDREGFDLESLVARAENERAEEELRYAEFVANLPPQAQPNRNDIFNFLNNGQKDEDTYRHRYPGKIVICVIRAHADGHIEEITDEIRERFRKLPHKNLN